MEDGLQVKMLSWDVERDVWWLAFVMLMMDGWEVKRIANLGVPALYGRQRVSEIRKSARRLVGAGPTLARAITTLTEPSVSATAHPILCVDSSYLGWEDAANTGRVVL